METIQVDFAVFGGGILGLWAANLALRNGFSVVLLENQALGSGQTIAAQGVLHGGAKYQVGGGKHLFSNRLAQAASIWDACLQGDGDLDLSSIRPLSPCQYLWVTDSLVSGLQARITAAAISSRTERVGREQAGTIFDTDAFHGALYRIQETVIPIPDLVTRLAQAPGLHLCKVGRGVRLVCTKGDVNHIKLATQDGPIRLLAQHYLFCAGEGNRHLIQQMDDDNLPHAQVRPLHQVFVKKKGLTPLYLVCTEFSKIPRLVLTTHHARDGETVWYLGGGLAESGVARSKQEQIAFAAAELAHLFPWVDLSDAHWGTQRINRAEPQRAGGARPQGPFFAVSGNRTVAWPTKLVLAPQLAKNMLQETFRQGLRPCKTPDPQIVSRLEKPAMAVPVWDRLL